MPDLWIRGPLARADLPGLGARVCALLDRADRQAGPTVRCRVDGLGADGVAVDALARLALAARRRGLRLVLLGASEDLIALIALMGLAEVLPAPARNPAAAAGRTAGTARRSPGRR